MASAPSLPTFTWDRPQRVAVHKEAVSMTHQHFQHIAESIASAPVDEETRSKLADHFAGRLSSTNGQFDRGRFTDVATGKRAR